MRKNFSLNASKCKIFFVFAATVVVMIACKQSTEKNTAATDATTTEAKFVSISETNIPDAPGVDAFKENCITCHSTRYVQMQPDFPRKTWEKIVDKMVKSYGASIPDSVAKNIVDYLVLVKKK